MNFDVRLPETDAILAAVRPYRPTRILNVGFGKGVISEKLTEVCPIVATVAPTDWLNHAHSSLADKVQIVPAHPCRLPFDDSSFDGVLCTHTLGYLQNARDRRKALGEMGRVIRPGGRLIMTVRHQNFRMDNFGWAKEGVSEGVFYHRYYLDELREQLAPCWHIEKMWGVWTYLPKTFRIYTSLGKFVVYWERALRTLPISLRYGKVLLAVCSPI